MRNSASVYKIKESLVCTIRITASISVFQTEGAGAAPAWYFKGFSRLRVVASWDKELG